MKIFNLNFKFLSFFLFLFVVFESFFVFGLDTNDEKLSYLYFFEDSNSLYNKVAYKIDNSYEIYNRFEMNIYYENRLVDKECIKDIVFDKNSIFQKITCEIPKLGYGKYVFDSFLKKDDKIIKRQVNQVYLNNDENLEIKFFDNKENNKTYFIIDINSKNASFVELEIPKSVIKYLDEKNKDELLKSNFDYQIIENDPLIAWHIEKPPAKINSTFNKKISYDARKDFNLKVKKSSSFKFLKILIFLIIILMVGFLIYPIFKNKKFNQKINQNSKN